MRIDGAILQVIPTLDSGGAERTTIEIARAIIASGGKAIIATEGGRLLKDAEIAGARIALLPVASKNPLTILANRARLIRLISEEKASLVHARSRAPAWSALMACRATSTPFVTTFHGAYRARSPFKRLYNSSMARGDLVIANSEFTAEALRRDYDVEDRLVVIPRGADLKEFNPEAISLARRQAILRHWEIGENSGRLIMVLPGRLTGWKGHRMALEAAARLSEGVRAGVFPEFKLIFAGDTQGQGGEAVKLARMVGELGLQDSVSMVGHCADMPAAYAVSDIVLSPSTRPEAFGRVAVEAGAMAKPVIAADHGGPRETVVNGETGFLIEPNSVDALEASIRKMAALGAGGRQALGARARIRISERFSTKAMTNATLAAYSRMIGGAGDQRKATS